MINPTPAKIEDILNSSIQFVVPMYQREYTWGKDEAVEFWDDLNSYTSPGSGSLFLGTIIFEVTDQAKKLIKIVDGQQRITTILVLLIACRQLAKKLNAHGLASIIQNKITFTDSTTAKSLGSRLISSESIKDVFDYIAHSDWPGDFPEKLNKKQVKRQKKKIKPTYDFFWERIGDYSQIQLSSLLQALYNAYVVRIDIEDEIEAFSIFERTNARGSDLEASDLLKNYLFSQGINDIDETWAEILSNSDGTILRMLKYFYVAKNGAVRKSELYRKLKTLANKQEKVPYLVNDLLDFSKYYTEIRNAKATGIKEYFDSIGCETIATDQNRHERIYLALEGLRLFKISQVYPLIYAAIGCFVRSGGGSNLKLSKRLVGLIETLEKYHFVNTAVSDRLGNEVENLYADFCVKLASTKDFEGISAEIVDTLKAQVASEDVFSAKFTEIVYTQDSIPLIVYIFDRIENSDLDPGARIPLFNPDPRVLRRNHNVEHFYPKSPASGITASNKATLDVVDNIGNLLVLPFRLNSRLGNLLPKEKIDSLKGERASDARHQRYLQEFIAKYEGQAANWNQDTIQERAEELAITAYRKIWRIS
jgi:uncharacterized protein with ParB-like and HNH nuclease domain